MDVAVPIWVVILVITLIVVLVGGLVASSATTRLSHIHIRTDLMRPSLEAALGQRAAVARAVYPGPTDVVTKVEAIPLRANNTGQRTDVGDELTRKTVALYEEQPMSRAMTIELFDARTRLELARRFYNDAVTGTKALRTRPLVRALRLAGTAPESEYFDVVDGLTTAQL